MDDELDIYRRQGIGNKLGFGLRPALAIIDFSVGFNDPDAFGGGNIDPAVKKTVGLLAAARRHGLPIAFTRIMYAEDGSNAGVFCLQRAHHEQPLEPYRPRIDADRWRIRHR